MRPPSATTSPPLARRDSLRRLAPPFRLRPKTRPKAAASPSPPSPLCRRLPRGSLPVVLTPLTFPFFALYQRFRVYIAPSCLPSRVSCFFSLLYDLYQCYHVYITSPQLPSRGSYFFSPLLSISTLSRVIAEMASSLLARFRSPDQAVNAFPKNFSQFFRIRRRRRGFFRKNRLFFRQDPHVRRPVGLYHKK